MAVPNLDRPSDTSGGGPAAPRRRLVVVCEADRNDGYDWLPQARAGDLTIALDGTSQRELAARHPRPFDELQSWEERSAAERHSAELLLAVREHPALAAIAIRGHSVIDFLIPRLRFELTRLLRGWALARAAGDVGELVCDPAAPAPLLMGLRAGLGLDPDVVHYTLPPGLPGSRVKRALMRPPMRVLAAVSKPERIRLGAVFAGKLTLALQALSDAQLRAIGVGAVPFPGLDHGNGALFALRRRLPLLATYGPRRPRGGHAAHLPERMPERLGLVQAEPLDRALTLLVSRMATAATAELVQATTALDALERARSLRALVLPNTGYGASRLLISWAHARGLRVGSLQHGIYALRNVDAGEQRADVILGWGAGTVEQVQDWHGPRPPVTIVGLPGMKPQTVGAPDDVPVEIGARRGHNHYPPAARAGGVPRRVLIATSTTTDLAIAPAAMCEDFVAVLAPALARLAAAGVELKLRPHPTEDPALYPRLLGTYALGGVVEVVGGGSFAAAITGADILISSVSSVAFEAAGLGLPVLMWTGRIPQWVREEHCVAPWSENAAGMFGTADELRELIDGMLARPGQTLAVAQALSRRLARFAEPFQPDRFAEALEELSDGDEANRS